MQNEKFIIKKKVFSLQPHKNEMKLKNVTVLI